MEPSVYGVLMKKVIIVDLGMGNIQSLMAAIEYLGAEFEVTGDFRVVANGSHVILPGVGAYDAAMKTMAERSLVDVLKEWAIVKERPLLGVCLGMQLLCESSEEGVLPGLGLAPGRFRRLQAVAHAQYKVPHVGFAEVYGYERSGIYDGLGERECFYFTHSYALEQTGADYRTALCDHSQPFVAAFQKGNVCGVQFHPEKSQATGLKVLANFLRLA